MKTSRMLQPTGSPEPRHVRDETASQRDEAAQKRDELAARRDREADIADQQVLELEDSDEALDQRTLQLRELRARGLEGRKLAARDRVRAEGDRRLAGADREFGESDREESKRDREHAATDELTGARRRGVGLEDLQREIDHVRSAGEGLVAAYVDVDGLKAVNDKHGHHAGDQLLQDVSKGLRRHMRSYDLLMRLGGDEFLCVLPGVTVEEARRRLERLGAELCAAPGARSISVGLAELRDGDGPQELIDRADQNLLSGRDRGRRDIRTNLAAVRVSAREELDAMAASMHAMQRELGQATQTLAGARTALAAAEQRLQRNLRQQAAIDGLRRLALEDYDLRELVENAADIGEQALDRPVEVSMLPAANGRELRAGSCPPGTSSIPIVSRNELLGELRVGSSPAPTADEIAFLEATANVIADRIQRSRAEQDMRDQALRDPLTGLPNRTLLGDRLAHALQRSTRGGPVAVLFVDLDDFKLINDSRGHRAGDELLCAVATRLRGAMRPGDTIARFGGDEFCIVCDDVSDVVEATAIASRVIKEIARPLALQSGEHLASASVGIALAGGRGQPAENVIRAADAAIYRAKEGAATARA